MLLFTHAIQSPKGTVYMDVSIRPKDKPTDKAAADISVYGSGHPLGGELLGRATVNNLESVEQIYSCVDKNGIKWNLDIHADERLRRMGREFIFDTDSEDELYVQHDGWKCTIERMLTAEENDILICGMMWKGKFEDGVVLDIFDDELTLPKTIKWDLEHYPKQQNPKESVSLNDKIQVAEECCETQKLSPDKAIEFVPEK